MQLDRLNILVVGAATGGAATALLLARSGARVTLVERFARYAPLGAGLALAANGRAVLEGLGLGPALGASVETSALRVTDAEGRTLAAPPAGARLMVVRRSVLQELLLDAVLAEPGITCRFGTTVERAFPDGRVELVDGVTTTTECFDLVIGADGMHSRVRAGGAFGARVHHTGIRYLRTIVPVPVGEGTEAWTPAGLFGAAPIDGGTYLYASCRSPALADAIDQRDLRALRAAWSAAYPRSARLLAEVARFDDLLIHEVVCVACARWHDGRLVLVGDAAHAMAPNLGQGANSALVDAAVLVDALRSAPDVATGLARYDARRRAKVRAVANTAKRLGRFAELTHPLARALRDRVLMPLVRLLPVDRQLRALLQESPETLLHIARA
jgi:2-polyprenyl-6-methoxyphenol hydroxylase-like FAD-dependent oxidoreductase